MKSGNTNIKRTIKRFFSKSFLFTAVIAATTGALSADEIRLVEYSIAETAGAEREYRISDGNGDNLGNILESITSRRSDGYFRIEGSSSFQAGDSTEFSAHFTHLQRFNDAGEPQIAEFHSTTESDGDSDESTRADFETPTDNFSSIAPGEERTISVRFTETRERRESEVTERTGTVERHWKMEKIEEIEVPAGVFTTARITITTELRYDDDLENPIVATETTWLAKGIGSVKRTFLSDSSAAIPASHELISYSIPEPSPYTLYAQDVGDVNHTGSSEYNTKTGVLTLTGSGAGIWGRHDGFHFLHQRTHGEAYIIARLTDVDAASDFAKAGIMIRESLDEGSRYAMISGTNNRSLSHDWRAETGGFSLDTSRWGTPTPLWLCLFRSEGRIYAYFSRNGSKWELYDEIELDFPDEIYIGLAVTSSDRSENATATFESVSYGGSPINQFQIVDADDETVAAPAAFATKAAESTPSVFFASTRGTLDPVEGRSFSLFLNRDGNSGETIPIHYTLSGPGAELVDEILSTNPLEMNSHSETGALTFTLKEGAYIPWDMEMTVELHEQDGYEVGPNDSVTFRIWARPIDSWKAIHFTPSQQTNIAVSSDHAAPAGDGVPNLLKYALGLSPQQKIGPEKLPVLGLDTKGASLQYERPADRRDVRYVVEVSTDLNTWASGDNHVELEITNLGDIERVIARDKMPVGSEQQRFMRLRVERR